VTGLDDRDRRNIANASELADANSESEITSAIGPADDVSYSALIGRAFARAQVEMRLLLEIIERLDDDEALAAEDTRRLADIRALLAAFDWEHDDRQLALEAIERIAAGDEDQADEDDGLEPYCSECGHWIGMFHGLDGWQHFRGDPAPGGQRQLYDAGHGAVPAWCQPPGRAISPADMVTVRGALADAENYRRSLIGAWCADCEGSPDGVCQAHLDDLGQADVYAGLARQLQQEEGQ
jgi:hypothetical protein